MLFCSCRGLDFRLPEQPLTLEQAARLTGSEGFKAPGDNLLWLIVLSSLAFHQHTSVSSKSRAQLTGTQDFKAPGNALLQLMVFSNHSTQHASIQAKFRGAQSFKAPGDTPL